MRSNRLLSAATIPLFTDQLRKVSKRVIDRVAIRKHIQEIGVDHNHICTFGESRRSYAANSRGEIIFRSHGIAIGRIASRLSLLLHIVFALCVLVPADACDGPLMLTQSF